MAKPPIDIPLVLEVLRPGEDWGPGANTGSTYAQLVAGWRGASPVPTQAEMVTAWDALLAARRKPRTLPLLMDAIAALSAGDRNRLLALVASDFLRSHPAVARGMGIPIDGDEPQPMEP